MKTDTKKKEPAKSGKNRKKKVLKKKFGKKVPGFDEKSLHGYVADVVLGPDVRKEISFEAKIGDGEKHLSFDEILDAAYEAMEREYPEEYYPKAEIDSLSIRIVEPDGIFRVLSETDSKKKEILGSLGKGERYLVLGERRYSLSDEFLIFEKLMKEGVLDEDTKFNPMAMRKALEIFRGKKTKNG